MSRCLDLDLVRTFVIAADHASMTAAANARCLTQGAVSQQIKRLEGALQCVLFERNPRGLRLTRAGEQLLPKAKHLLSLNDEVWSEMVGGSIRGGVRIGLPYDLVGTLMAPVLKAFADAYPEVEVSLLCASSPELVSILANGEIDLAVMEEPATESTGECLRVEQLVWVGAKSGLAHLKTPLPISMVDETCVFRPAVLAALQGQNQPWRTVFESGNIEATMATVRTDLAISAWLAATVPIDLEILKSGDVLPDLPQFAITLHAPASGLTPAAAEMAHYIRENMASRTTT